MTYGVETTSTSVRVACAGWTLPKEHKPLFPEEGPHLGRFASVFSGVEINSSFHRRHRESTYRRWAQTVPDDFRFAVKVSKEITHETRLRLPPLLDAFLPGPLQLGEKLGPLLVQLPPSLAFDRDVADAFFAELRERFEGHVVCEPRHASWFTDEVETVLESHVVARVAADPAPAAGAGRPGAWRGVTYFRLHGSPRMYYSAYDEDFLAGLAAHLADESGETWCVFDNTARGAAIPNALRMMDLLRGA